MKAGHRDGLFGVADTVVELESIRRALASITLGLAYAIPNTAEFAAKALLARHLYWTATGVEALARRIRELPLAPEEVAARTEDGPAGPRADRTVRSLYEADIPRAQGAVREVLARLLRPADDPSAIVLETIDQSLQEQVCEFRALGDDDARVAAWADVKVAGAQLFEEPNLPPGTLVDDKAEPPQPQPGSGTAAFLNFLYGSIELFTMDACARLILAGKELLPWAFVTDMSRQCWDEARHASGCAARIEELGSRVGDFPISTRLWKVCSGLSMTELLTTNQRVGEWMGVESLLAVREKLRSQGDHATALLVDYMARDEIQHVAYGNKWLRHLLHDEQGAMDRLDIGALVRRQTGRGMSDAEATREELARRRRNSQAHVGWAWHGAGFLDREAGLVESD